jgi:glycosylphosphatidylinositol transamidase (GPIT) subunit GPI8
MNIQTTEFRLVDGIGGDIITQIGENVRLWETYSPNYQAVTTSEQASSTFADQLIGQAIADSESATTEGDIPATYEVGARKIASIDDNISTQSRYNIAAAYVARFSFESLKGGLLPARSPNVTLDFGQ